MERRAEGIGKVYLTKIIVYLVWAADLINNFKLSMSKTLQAPLADLVTHHVQRSPQDWLDHKLSFTKVNFIESILPIYITPKVIWKKVWLYNMK